MCGIVGFIGKPTDSKVAFELTTSLLAKTEVRGDDASGFWASDSQNDQVNPGTVLWSKSPAAARLFVKQDPWQALASVDTNLLVAHCRRSTIRGSENINRNNHPFLSDDSRIALVHNGNIPEHKGLRPDYDMHSECDSEVLLRIMERGVRYDTDYLKKQLGDLDGDVPNQKIKDCSDNEIPRWSHRLLGMVDIFARVNYGAMAVAVGERWEDGTRALWLFRNKERPLHVVDMRESLGQIYVVSERSIWREAVESTPSAKKIVRPNTPIIDFPTNCVWLLKYHPDTQFTVRKFLINRQRRHDTTFAKERPTQLLPESCSIAVRVITNLTDAHEVTASGLIEKNIVKTVSKKKKPDKTNLPAKLDSTTLMDTPTKSDSQATSSPPPEKLFEDLGPCFEGSTKLPTNLFKYMAVWIAAQTDQNAAVVEMPSEEDILTAARELYEATIGLSIPDPVVTTAQLSDEDYTDWAQCLKQYNGWTNLSIVEGDNKIGPLCLSKVLQEARISWCMLTDINNRKKKEAGRTELPFCHTPANLREPTGGWPKTNDVFIALFAWMESYTILQHCEWTVQNLEHAAIVADVPRKALQDSLFTPVSSNYQTWAETLHDNHFPTYPNELKNVRKHLELGWQAWASHQRVLKLKQELPHAESSVILAPKNGWPADGKLFSCLFNWLWDYTLLKESTNFNVGTLSSTFEQSTDLLASLNNGNELRDKVLEDFESWAKDILLNVNLRKKVLDSWTITDITFDVQQGLFNAIQAWFAYNDYRKQQIHERVAVANATLKCSQVIHPVVNAKKESLEVLMTTTLSEEKVTQFYNLIDEVTVELTALGYEIKQMILDNALSEDDLSSINQELIEIRNTLEAQKLILQPQK